MYTPTPVPTTYNDGMYTPLPPSSTGSFAFPSITQPAPASPADSAAASAAAAANAALAKEVASEVTNVNRFNDLLTVDGAGMELLPEEELRKRVVFDFAAAQPLGAGGRFAAANAGNFPILVDQGLSTAVAFLNPCGMNSPHSHPRAAEWLTVVQGSVKSGFMMENGLLPNREEGRLTTQITSELSAFQGTVFPQGSIHFQFNDNCEPATFVATLSSEDPGTSQIAQNFFFLDEDVVSVVLGDVQQIDGSNIEDFRTTLPPNLVQAVDSCLARCNKY